MTLDVRTHCGPMLNSANTAWAGLPFELHSIGSAGKLGEVGPPSAGCNLFVMMEGHADFVVRTREGDQHYGSPVGTVDLVVSPRRRHIVRMSGSGTAIAMRITPAWLRRLAVDESPIEFIDRVPFTPDETIHRLVQLMCSEVERNAATGPLFAESLSLALLSHLTRRVPLRTAAVRGNLSRTQCLRLRDHIHANLGGELSLLELAALTGLGARHFSTLFRRTFGVTPHKYVMQQRLSEGARQLAGRAADIGAVAARVGFCSQSHFTAAFRQAYGITPRRYLLDVGGARDS
jgi:AraC-like DNA-binding protein